MLGLPSCAGLKRAGLTPKGQKDAGLWVHGGGQQRIGVFSGQRGSFPASRVEGGIRALTLPAWVTLGKELYLSEPESFCLGKGWL